MCLIKEFNLGLRKCAVSILKRGKFLNSEGIKLPDDEIMKKVKENINSYLRIEALDKIKGNEKKNKVLKECKRRQKEHKLNGNDKVKKKK